MLIESTTLAVALVAVWKLSWPAAMKALRSARLPLRVSALLVPPTVTEPLLVALRVPLGTEKVAVTVFEPASGSAKLMPVRTLAWSSVTLRVAGAVICGASFTAVTLSTLVARLLSAVPSLTWKLMVRAAVLGASEPLL